MEHWILCHVLQELIVMITVQTLWMHVTNVLLGIIAQGKQMFIFHVPRRLIVLLDPQILRCVLQDFTALSTAALRWFAQRIIIAHKRLQCPLLVIQAHIVRMVLITLTFVPSVIKQLMKVISLWRCCIQRKQLAKPVFLVNMEQMLIA
jgi:hypothetical protein